LCPFQVLKSQAKKKLRECQQSHKCRHRAIVAYKYAIHIYQQNDNIKRIIVERLIGDAEKLLMSLRELYIESSTTVMPCMNNKEKKDVSTPLQMTQMRQDLTLKYIS